MLEYWNIDDTLINKADDIASKRLSMSERPIDLL